MEYLDYLESEAISILRETASQFRRPVLLFSGGKDSTVLFHLSLKAFSPGKIPFPLLHVDTGHNFPEALAFRDALVSGTRSTLIVRLVEDTIKNKNLPDAIGKLPSRNALQTHTLLDTIKEFSFDVLIGGARRDEEKARAKERVFSVRDKSGQWNPGCQRPELWNILNGRISEGEHVRSFPISNWTELDVWNYIKREQIVLPSIYYSHTREVIVHNDQLVAVCPYITLDGSEQVVIKNVRYRTVGDMTCTAAIESLASNAVEVIEELRRTKISERGETRIDDRVSETAMEDRKRMGYF